MEQEYNHIWKNGEWSRDQSLGWDRRDVCVLCGCKRMCGRDNKKSETEVFLYDRSKIVTSEDPGCWGAKSPQ